MDDEPLTTDEDHVCPCGCGKMSWLCGRPLDSVMALVDHPIIVAPKGPPSFNAVAELYAKLGDPQLWTCKCGYMAVKAATTATCHRCESPLSVKTETVQRLTREEASAKSVHGVVYDIFIWHLPPDYLGLEGIVKIVTRSPTFVPQRGKVPSRAYTLILVRDDGRCYNETSALVSMSKAEAMSWLIR